ncbi:MAG: calcium/sodium antiporter [Anaerotignum sp.]|nr:calcium/sodium antiporter [Anaerotignum sp.]MBP3628652.1 calcium/sodium antiporter [Anaerotignum sp.]
MGLLTQVLLLVVGFVLLVKGADWFVEGAASIADKFGIPQIVIGLTIVAMGTSAPEAAVSISAALKGSAEITIGNVLGSNILNILIILGLTSVIRTIFVQRTTIHYEIPMVIGITVLLAVMGLQNHVVSRLEGVILVGCMVIYMMYLLRLAKRGSIDNEELDEFAEKSSMAKLIFLVIIGVAAIVWGSDIAVNAATAIARIFGMSERFIGLTIVALGTSLPELVTSVTAALKGNCDIAVGNIVGSNLFNIMFVVGITAIITPVVYAPAFKIDSAVAVGAVVLLWLCVLRKQTLNRLHGIIMLLCYGGYFAYLMV